MPTSAALRVVNQARVLEALRRRGPHSRASLSQDLKLTRSTVTVIISALLESGLVHEVNTEVRDPRATGRPRVEVSLRSSGAYFGGLDLGNENLTAVIVDLAGQIVEEGVRTLDAGTQPEEAEAILVQMVGELLARRPDITLEGIGLTVPGVVTPDGELQWAPRLGWRNVRIGDLVRAAVNVPVFVENDANAAAMGEAHFSDPAHVPNLLYVLLESGVGAGLLVQGHLYRGSLGRVGEAGHIRLPNARSAGRTVLVEDVLDAAEFLRAAQNDLGSDVTWELLGSMGDDLPPVLTARRDGWQETLGWLTSTLVWLFDPDLIVFGGSGATLLEHDRQAFETALTDNGLDVTTTYVISQFGRRSTTMGAVALPMRSFFAVPHDIFTSFPVSPGTLEAVS